jgi:hypothetical protein
MRGVCSAIVIDVCGLWGSEEDLAGIEKSSVRSCIAVIRYSLTVRDAR